MHTHKNTAKPKRLIKNLPPKSHLYGPLTQLKLSKILMLYACFLAIGLAVLVSNSNPYWQSMALNLMLPGGGFWLEANLNDSHGLVFLLSGICAIILFASSLIAWLGTGNILLPPTVWLGAGGLTMLAHQPLNQVLAQLCKQSRFNANLAACLIAFLFIVCLLCWWLNTKQALLKRQQNQHYLQQIAPNIAASFVENSAQNNKELSPNELALMRFVLDRALQPIEQFDGFNWIDQFQTAAVRYQLNFMGYALAMLQKQYTPAFAGDLNTAQSHLLHKQTQHKIWRYWQLENAWGNLSLNANPMERENIMYTGFCALQMAMFHAASGTQPFVQANSFKLITPKGKTFTSSFVGLIHTVEKQFRSSPFCLISCEPNWTYPLCNAMTAAAIKAYDSQHQTTLWPAMAPAFTQALEDEFISLSGEFIPCISTRTGLSLPLMGGALPQAMTCYFLNATLPEIALRQWLITRQKLLLHSAAPKLNLKAFWAIDIGNYGISRAAAYAGVALCAKEFGDDEIADLCLQQLDADYPAHHEHGHFYRPKASVWTHAVELLARCNRKDSFRQLITPAAAAKHNPIISQANYPQVLVAHASAQNHGLNAVLYPGQDAGVFELRLSHLQALARYECSGALTQNVLANAQGEATVRIDLQGRTHFSIHLI